MLITGKERLGKGEVLDTSELIYRPSCINEIRSNGDTAIIPMPAIYELDKHVNNPDIGYDAREARAIIEDLRKTHALGIDVVFQKKWPKNQIDLDRSNPDHQIIATANHVYFENKQKRRYREVGLKSLDAGMRLIAREVNPDLVVDSYDPNDVPREVDDVDVKKINVDSNQISNTDSPRFPYLEKYGLVYENENVLCCSETDGEWLPTFTATRRGDYFHINEDAVSVFGIGPKSLNGNGFNWLQKIAFHQILDTNISLNLLLGGAGTGKTLIALACSLELRRKYRQILITRPMVHLEDKDNMGYLPGDIREKMDPWMRPIWQNLAVLKEVSCENRQEIDKMLTDRKIDLEPLDYIRGTTFVKSIIIVDEAQNLTPHQVKTIITRAGEGTKIILTGDVSQIDRKKRMSSTSNGLYYAKIRMKGQPCVGINTFKETVRSELAAKGAVLL